METELSTTMYLVLKALARFIIVGTAASGLSYGTIQFIFKPAGKKVASLPMGAVQMRLIAVVVGMIFTAVMHGNATVGSELYFGEGAAGWSMALASGFAGGGFSGKFHDAVSGYMSRKKGTENG